MKSLSGLCSCRASALQPDSYSASERVSINVVSYQSTQSTVWKVCELKFYFNSQFIQTQKINLQYNFGIWYLVFIWNQCRKYLTILALVKCGIIVVWPMREWYCGFEKSGPRGPAAIQHPFIIQMLNVVGCWFTVSRCPHSLCAHGEWRPGRALSLDPLSVSGNYWVLMQGRGWEHNVK